ncbi:MAG: 3'(2'),5'-bisphosphate nucleotidase CysQ [Solidesulfovibrio sp. DCME]|uniref:3'(2'),5'-bisphosphate nucleotidase CysQ n=1 Tax=Solidesulfovibrio sp. DCME TaxID=3447380 RepID=UPI003D14AE1D
MQDSDLAALGGLARLAGQAVRDIARSGFTVAQKADRSPVTAADTASSDIILAGLNQLFPGLPVVCEETKAAPYAERRNYKCFFLVDPLDGTKEFIQGRDDYCVLIALIEDGRPVCGVIHAPASDRLYCGGPGIPSTRRTGNGPPQALRAVAPRPGEPLVVMASRSHPDAGLDAYLARFPGHRRVSRGSALKLAALAEGACHLYPRLGPTWEWDIAAGHAVLLGAGGELTAPDGAPFAYNKPELLNGPFLARSFCGSAIDGISLLS